VVTEPPQPDDGLIAFTGISGDLQVDVRIMVPWGSGTASERASVWRAAVQSELTVWDSFDPWPLWPVGFRSIKVFSRLYAAPQHLRLRSVSLSQWRWTTARHDVDDRRLVRRCRAPVPVTHRVPRGLCGAHSLFSRCRPVVSISPSERPTGEAESSPRPPHASAVGRNEVSRSPFMDTQASWFSLSIARATIEGAA
jgi:hypothetical protein